MAIHLAALTVGCCLVTGSTGAFPRNHKDLFGNNGHKRTSSAPPAFVLNRPRIFSNDVSLQKISLRNSVTQWQRHDMFTNPSSVPLFSQSPRHSSEESPLDPSILYDDRIEALSKPSSWGVADDWSALSSADGGPSSFSSSNMPLGSDFDAMEEAARILDEQNQISTENDFKGQWNADSGNGIERSALKHYTKDGASEDDKFVEDAVEIIINNLDYNDPEDMNLYDTAASAGIAFGEVKYAVKNNGEYKSKDMTTKENQDEEIAFMIRCNQSPQQFLISHGRALAELTDEDKYRADFLLKRQRTFEGGRDEKQRGFAHLEPKMTPFFQNAVREIFQIYSHAVPLSGDVETKLDFTYGSSLQVMDRSDLSKWMTKCLSSPFNSNKEPVHVGAYDKSISAILSRYSNSHGSGRLNLDEFQSLYLECAWAGHIRNLRENKSSLNEAYKIPSVDERVIIKERKNTEQILENASLDIVWRDLEAHGFFSPAEVDRYQLLKEMENIVSSAAAPADSEEFVDECELFDEYEDRLLHRMDSDDNNFINGGIKKKERSSYELVEMAYDGKTPRRMRDGKFVFIDEESCIGCTQCAQISPSSFKMLEESGRARTYFQRNTLDVENAVLSCPVSCMHMVSFDELKEMEVSRDHGDGRNDHRHFGQGRSHTPLHVARRVGDANHKSSWYHFLKSKCTGSGQCPQRGCYDCPKYAPGQNPFFIERHKEAEHIRAKDFINSGEANQWRKVVDL